MRKIGLILLLCLISLVGGTLLGILMTQAEFQEALEMLEQRVKILETRVVILEHPELLLKPQRKNRRSALSGLAKRRTRTPITILSNFRSPGCISLECQKSCESYHR